MSQTARMLLNWKICQRDILSMVGYVITNVSVVYFTTVTLLPLLQAGKESHGYLSASMSGIMRHAQGQFSYNAAKGATTHLARLISYEFKKASVRDNSITLGYFPSEMWGTLPYPSYSCWISFQLDLTLHIPRTTMVINQYQKGEMSRETIEAKGHVPMKRAGSDEEIGLKNHFLGQEHYINGELISIDGGSFLKFPTVKTG
jgi:NAD(P)-dependent dehydrogenase (short-subunit alcohol dehydrogenase family)